MNTMAHIPQRVSTCQIAVGASAPNLCDGPSRSDVPEATPLFPPPSKSPELRDIPQIIERSPSPSLPKGFWKP